MPGDEVRARYLRDRVMTATPAQRVVMLYDRLGLDLARAADSEDLYHYGQNIAHAMEVLAELRASLDLAAGGPAENLAAIYGYLLGELVAARGGDRQRLSSAGDIIKPLRDAWARAGELSTVTAPAAAAVSGRWLG
jgi:flagellar protein FliS